MFALPKRYLYPPLWSEVFRYVRPGGATDGPFTIETGPLGQALVDGMHRSVAAIAASGVSVIVDHVLLETAWLDACRTLWQDLDWLFVGVRCPLAVVEQRERDRQDRTIGQAAAQFAVVHEDRDYDLEVDTSVLSPDDAAARIVAALDGRP